MHLKVDLMKSLCLLHLLAMSCRGNEFYAAVTQCVFVDVNQTFNGVFMKANTATLSMLRKVEPYVIYG